MAISIYQLALLFLFVYVIRLCVRSLLHLRFHFQFGRIGFFSISNILYRHHKHSEAALWSIQLGKLKLRLKKRPTLSSPSIYITIHVEDFSIQLHNLSALRKQQQLKRRKTDRQSSTRLSIVSSSLKRIPWWYSLSIVKNIIKFTSALPAQLLMAGLANYVDLKIENLTIDIEQQTSLKVQQLSFNSILYADVTINSIDQPIPSSVSSSPQQQEFKFENLFPTERSHQRHSLKRANHLFKEKFFEIAIQIGPISITDHLHSTDMLSLPLGGNIAISCHLSAACVTLKDINVKTQINECIMNINPISSFLDQIKTAKDNNVDSVENKPNRAMLQVFHSLNISISNTMVKMERENSCSTSLFLEEIQVSAKSETHALTVEPYYKLQCLLGKTGLTLQRENDKVEILHISEIKYSANIAQTMLYHKNSYSITNADPHSSNDLDMVNACWIDEMGPNKRYVNMNVILHEPRIFIDISRLGMFRNIKISGHTANKAHTDNQQQLTQKREFTNLPRFSAVIFIQEPSIEFVPESSDHVGLISLSNLNFEFDSNYYAQKSHRISLSSRPEEQNTEKEHIQFVPNMSTIKRPQSQSRPSWINLFRRSWKIRGLNDSNDKEYVEWLYKITCNVSMQNLRVTAKDSKSHFVSITNCEFNIHTSLDVRFLNNSVKDVCYASWDPDAHQIEIESKTSKVTCNFWAVNSRGNRENILEFWLKHIVQRLQVEFAHTNQSRNTERTHDSNDLSSYATVVKATVIFEEVELVLEGMDRGLKGKRAIPAGFLDNAPKVDTYTLLLISVGQMQLNFNGSRKSVSSRQSLPHKQPKSNRSSHLYEGKDENHVENNLCIPFGSFRASIQNFLIERAFKQDEEKYKWQQQNDPANMIMWISHISARSDISMLASKGSLIIRPSILVKKNGIKYSLTNHYAALIVLMCTLADIKNNMPVKATVSNSTKRAAKISIQQLQFQVNRTDVSLSLPNNTELYLRMDTIRGQWDNQAGSLDNMPKIVLRNITLYGVAPRQPGKWDQLLEFDNVQFSIVKDVDFNTGELIKTKQLSMSKLYLRIPYGYELANFVDSTVTLLKAIKATHSRLLNGVPFLFFGPHEKKQATVLPNIRLVCDYFTFQFEDDPFEARLRVIWKAGLIEQITRNAVQEAFESKAKALMEQYAAEIKLRTDEDSVYLNEEAEMRVNEAWHGLQEHHSKSWRRHVDAALFEEKSTFEKLQNSYYRCSAMTDQLDEVFLDKDKKTAHLSDAFCIDIVDLPQFPPLLDLSVMSMSLEFSPPEFDVKNSREFIFEVGKGQPLDTPLSTLIPFHLSWKSGKTWAQLRDYPIPFLLVPSPNDSSLPESELSTTTTDSNTSYAWTLSGNYVIADDLGDLEATRSIHVPVVYDIYSIDIARTTTPLKFFSIVNIDVHNSTLSHICWSVPYQPAIQDITRVLDTFTKPPVDPSAKIGFWDKIRLIIHTRTQISFVGGGDLAIVMKGSRDPYDLSEKGLGLAKVWRNNVKWLLGHENPEEEFMQIISSDYAFGVPDLLLGGYMDPSIIAASHYTKENSSSETSEHPIRQTTSMSSFNSSTFSIDNHNESRFVKIALKLSGGIRMGIGCHLERKCNPNCEICDENNEIPDEARDTHKSRLLHFLPHFKVKLKAPQNVNDENYDAYRGFRSDFIHFSISIIKLPSDDTQVEKKTITGNSMHLTPGFLDHFVSWFRLFGGAMGYPLRAGSLFPKTDNRPTQKFGRHMSTMKYKVVVNPLTVSYFLKDENIVTEGFTTEEMGDSVGLKGFVDKFSVDIHQRREIVNVSDYKLDQKRLKANWPVTEAEIQLNDVDLRAVKASYTHNNADSFSSSSADNISVPIQVDKYYADDGENGLNMMEGLNYQCNTDSDSSDWIDLDDFIEIGVAAPSVLPTIQVLPFAFVPCIYYLRQTNRGDVQKYKYLHKTHDCSLGTAMNTRDVQMSLLRERSNNIDIQIRKHQARLHSIETKRLQHGEDEKSLEELSDTIVEKTRILYEKRELLQQYLKELSTLDDADSASDKKYGINESRIFGRNSLAQWEELMGHFKVRYIAHNPQILWNNSIRNIVYHALDLREHRHALSYYMSMRTMKFLRDMIDASSLNYNHTHKPFVLDDEEGGMDSSMAEELISKLLAEKDTKFFAPNETEEEKTVKNGEMEDIDMTQSQNINDPLLQLKNIPDNYVMKSSYLVDFLNPQISLQSDCDPNNIVLVANERTQVKGFNIIDETDPDAEMELVKHRTIVSLENLQFFVAKKEQFDSVDLLLDNHYGAKESDHWLAWIPPEMLISYVRSSDKFQRVGDRIAATLQYDKYNPLRIKSSSALFSQIHPFEDRCDSVQLNFPELRFTADSSQYNAIYQVATDLLLYKEPAKKERLARLREIMMAADRASLYETTEKIGELQNRVRQLISTREEYRQNLSQLESKHIEEFKSVRLALYDALEELYLGMEAIKLMQSNQRKDYHEPKTNLKFVFCADKVEWKMQSSDETSLCECILSKFSFNFVSKEDHSSINTLEVEVVQVKNLSTSPVFVDVLGPFIDARKPYDFSRHKMLRCYFVSLAPVGGIPVIQHLEINLHPLRVQMTYSFGKALAYYLFPPEKQQKQLESVNMATSTSTPTTSVTLTSNIDFTTDRQGVSDLIPLAASEKSDSSTVRSTANSTSTAHNSSAPPSINLTAASPDIRKSTINNGRLDASESLMKEEMDHEISNDSTITTISTPQQSKKLKKQNMKAKLKSTDDLSVMKKRASSNRTFILVKIPGAKHCLSYQGPKDKNIEDLRDFAFEQPTLEFRNEIWSWFELASNIKKDFMKAALLHNSTALLKEKILRRHHRENNRLTEPSLSFSSTPIHTVGHSSVDTPLEAHPQTPTIDVEATSESSRDEIDDASDIKDTASLHSAPGQDIWDTENSENSSKRTHLWSKFKKSKKHPNTLETSNQENLSASFSSAQESTLASNLDIIAPPALSRSVSAATRHLQDNDQLTVKGRYLLGKYYNGPTQWLSSKGNKPTKRHL